MAAPHHSALLLVDGYNIIGAWSSLQKTRDRHGLESARQELVESLINYTTHQGFKTQVVFDSQYQKTPCSEESHTPSLSVYFTAWAQTADTYIEKTCATLYRQPSCDSSRVIVATSDRAQRLTVLGYGAEWMSAQRLANEVEVIAFQVQKKQRSQKHLKGRFLFNALDAKAQKRFAEWRQGQD